MMLVGAGMGPRLQLAARTTGAAKRLLNAATTKRTKNKPLSVEEEFQRLTPLEHILKCPNMYIGATSMTEKNKPRYMVSSLTATRVKFEKIDQPFIPGIVKIFDEVLVNACDNVVRDPVGTKNIDVTYNSKDGSFTVRNTGKGIPVKIHPKEKLYVPELVLGHLLTGSNFEKIEANSTGGRHGYGAKLCNVFSSRFSVETIDSETGLKFIRRWKHNMQPDGDAEIAPVKDQDPYTLVSFAPDWSRFGLRAIDPGSLAMIKTRVAETAGLLGPNVAVTWNGTVIPLKSFEDLCKSCFTETPNRRLVFSRPTDHLRVALGLSDDGFSEMSFVNSMSTHRGGSHVEAIVSQVTKRIVESTKGAEFSEREVRKHLSVFVDFRTNFPEFDSQSKDRLTSNLANDPNIILTETFVKRFVSDSGIVDALQTSASAKVEKVVNKRVAVQTIPKLEDALRAGTNESEKCTLIVTEGDSAKALAMEGISVVGRRTYGVYPLRGKVLNVRDKPMQEVAENKEILNIINALGLKVGANSTSGLRYGRVMFMTDQDHDGSHIKGLLLNFFDTFWPELAQKPGFLTQFITPLLKAKPRNPEKPVREFFNQNEFERWIKENPNYLSQYKIKYYKGLGTSTAQEAREYFSNLDRHVVDFSFARGDMDRELLDKVFRSERAHERKAWLRLYRASDEATRVNTPTSSSMIPPAETNIGSKRVAKPKGKAAGKSLAAAPHRIQTVESFINTDFAAFSWHDVQRSIPSVFDGLKPSQRKVFYALLEKLRSSSDEIKVAQLAGYVAEVTSYHHGERSLLDTIVNMAQDFVGANNLPLLRSEGQFGTRLQGGKDAAAARYIFTGLSPIARLLFPAEDDRLLVRRMEDGNVVEPRWYLPIVPLVLINGSSGIGTGWSCNIPAHHPLEVCSAVQAMIDLDEKEAVTGSPIALEKVLECVPNLTPWYKGYRGSIIRSSDRFVCEGLVELVRKPRDGKDPYISIRELPLGMWTEDFKERIVQHIRDQKLREYKDESADPSQIDFRVYADDPEEYMLTECSKWRTYLDMRNMNLFDSSEAIRHFADAREILLEFFEARLVLYSRRRESRIRELSDDLQSLIRERDLARKIIQMDDHAGKNSVARVQLLGGSVSAVFTTLEALGFSRGEVERMMKKPIGEFTFEKVQELEALLVQKKRALDETTASTPHSLWRADISKLRKALEVDERFSAGGPNMRSLEKPLAAPSAKGSELTKTSKNKKAVSATTKRATEPKETATKSKRVGTSLSSKASKKKAKPGGVSRKASSKEN